MNRALTSLSPSLSRSPSRSLSLSLAAGLAIVVAVASACPAPVAAPCRGANCEPVVNNDPPRFFAEPPFGVGFDCVTLGCDTTKPLTIENRGGGKLGIALVRLSVDSSTDFTLARADGEQLPCAECANASEDDPRIVFLGPGEQLELAVRYQPSDDELDEGVVQMEHFDGALPYLESAPKVDEVPLTARAFGSPAASLPVEVLDFGFVEVGSQKTLELVVDNIGNESVLRVGRVERELGTSPAFYPPSPRDWGDRFANPGEAARIPVTFAPTSADAFIGAIALSTNDPLRPGVRVVVQGTAIPAARLGIVEPVGDLVLPDVRLGETRTGRVVVRNLGGTPLDLAAAMDFFGVAHGFTVTPANVSQVMPLQTAELEVALTPAVGGDAVGTINLTANDPTIPAGVGVVARAFVKAPRLTASPNAVSFGQVVQGWTAEPRTLTLGNDGFGELEITSIAFELGSSSQISVVDVPPLPRKLAAGETITLTFLLTATNIGPATSVLLVASDSIDVDVRRLDVFGDVITCEQGCPIPNGTPQCGAGFCQVGTCIDDFHNPDGQVSNGCECGEDVVGGTREDIGQACPGLTIPDLHDGNDGGTRSTTRNGTLHSAQDMDLYFFRAKDDSCFLCGDNYGADVTLTGPAGMQLCVNYQQGGTGCGGGPTNCATIGGSGQVRLAGSGQGGIFGSGDNDEDVTVFVLWNNAQQICASYSLFMRADGNF